jgi:predicted ATP-dependent endonuclease of OLD family
MDLTHFRVTKYRNIWDSGWIDVNKITAFVGQNEAGKSNLFEALYRINPFVPNETYNLDEDWPVDDWGNKDVSAVVCEAKFSLINAEIEALCAKAAIPRPTKHSDPDNGQPDAQEPAEPKAEAPALALSAEMVLIGSRSYSGVDLALGRAVDKFDSGEG